MAFMNTKTHNWYIQFNITAITIRRVRIFYTYRKLTTDTYTSKRSAFRKLLTIFILSRRTFYADLASPTVVSFSPVAMVNLTLVTMVMMFTLMVGVSFFLFCFAVTVWFWCFCSWSFFFYGFWHLLIIITPAIFIVLPFVTFLFYRNSPSKFCC